MDNLAVRRAGELESPVRQWLQHTFGRALSDDEHVSILLSPPRAAPAGGARQAAAERLFQTLDRMDAKTKGVPPEELDDAVDEAMRHVRRREP